jgi:methylated-DNA-[protein]-cysteine S-methyltransferase
MSQKEYAVFETEIGHCGIAWGARGCVGVSLPESSASATRARMQKRFPGASEAAPPPDVTRAIEAIRSLLRGEPVDLSGVDLDMHDLPEFNRSVYEITRTIAPGRTLTYGDIAARVGTPKDARAVGQALGRNPFPIVVPCHRVVASDGRMHGFSGPGGVTTKLRLLQIEGYEPNPGPSLFDDHPSPSAG